MSSSIESAIPTDPEAIEYITKDLKLDDLAIPPLLAKKLYPDYISDKKKFICPTDNCGAPITCRSILLTSKNRPTFVNQSIVVNKHIEGCKHNPNYREKEDVQDTTIENFYSQINSNDTVSDLSAKKGFLSNEAPKKTTNREHVSTGDTSETTTRNVSITKGKTQTRVTNQHLKSLQDHAELYKYNPEFLLGTRYARNKIPIKYIFKTIKRNIFFNQLTSQKYASIYYGNAKLSQPENEVVIRVQFLSPIPINDQTDKAWPALIISKSYFEDEYPDILAAFEDGAEIIFEAFITLPFIFNGEYLNFSSFSENIVINPFDEELFNNFYIRTKN
ncbi:hypothetical protein [Enterococcus rotai]|uniref:hypothetical protein n=1 Tax=Enterococcus rotai TaxID=118060 RepID=UPI0032B4EAFA